MSEAGLGDFSRANVAAKPRVALENADLSSCFGKQGCSYKGIDSTADKDGIERVHHSEDLAGPDAVAVKLLRDAALDSETCRR